MTLSASRNVIAVIVALLLGGSIAAAEHSLVGSLDAVSDEPIPPGTAVAVSAESFTDLNNRLQPMIETALAAEGYRVDPAAQLELTFDAGSTDTSTAARLAEPKDSVLDHIEIENVQRRNETLNPLDTSLKSMELESMEGGVKLDLENTGDDEDAKAHHVLSFILGARGLPPVWQGSLRAPAQPQDPFVILKRMVPVLAQRIGETVNGEQIDIP